MYNNDLYTIPASLAGLPCMTVPIGLSENKMPIGIQIIAPPFQEEKMFKMAQFIEENYSIKK